MARRGLVTKSFSVSVAQIMSPRTQRFESVTPSTRVLNAVERMACNNVGSLIVMENGALRGIVTERDVLVNVTRMVSNTNNMYVRDIMTHNPVTVDASSTVGECLSIMSKLP